MFNWFWIIFSLGAHHPYTHWKLILGPKHLCGENVSRVEGATRLLELQCGWASQRFLHFLMKLGKPLKAHLHEKQKVELLGRVTIS